jgi:hypothetical protein
MSRGSLAYERMSRTSQALIVSFSLALVLMIGWFALLIMFSPDASTMTADPVAALPPAGPPQVENPPYNTFPLARSVEPSQSNSSPPWGNGIASIPTLPSAPVGAPFTVRAPPPAAPAEAPAAAPPASYGTSSVGAAAIDYRSAPTDYPNSPDGAAADISPVPLPAPRPRNLGLTPVPRPRPHIDEQADAQPPQEKSLFDLMIERQR